MTHDVGQPMEFLAAEWGAPDNVVALTSCRQGGVSKSPYDGFNLAQHVGDNAELVAQNRAALLAALDGAHEIQWLEQTHSTRVITAAQGAPVQSADGLVCRNAGIACAVLTADCLPVFLASNNGDEVAVIHCGWRGLAEGILENALAQLNSKSSDLHAWLGPAIGPCHFEVGQDVPDAFAAAYGDTFVSACFEPAGSKYMGDLYKMATLVLQQHEVVSVSGQPNCTYSDSERFYSYRRDGQTGRMASIIYIAEQI